MFMEILYAMLGPWSRDFIPWIVEHPYVLAIVYLAWLILFWLGKHQVKRVEEFLTEWVRGEAKELKAQHIQPDPDQLYKRASHELKQNLPHLAWFIPHKTEMFPVPARLDIVEKKINLSPDWIRNALKQTKAASKG